MFSSNHYVPILKWKRAEQGALKGLGEDTKKYLTPLVQFVMPKPKADEQLEDLISRFIEEAPTISTNLLEIWGRSPIFTDVSLLFTDELKAKSLEIILQGGLNDGGFFIPVIHIRDNSEIRDMACSFAKKKSIGLGLRLVTADLDDIASLNSSLEHFLHSSGLEAKNIDLILDIKETDRDGGKYSYYLNQSQDIFKLLEWRTFTFAAGSFPVDLSECKLDEENLIPRIEWDNWKKRSFNNQLRRIPAFSDYAIQHPIYKETAQFFHPTSSIKYTLDDFWLIMKGRKQKFELYLASAAELVKDSRFYGEMFSEGDKYIVEKAKHFETYIRDPKVKGTGSTETWLKAGINHHLVLTAHQVSNLS